MHLELHVVHEERLPLDSLTFNALSDDDTVTEERAASIRSVFQVWQRRYDPQTGLPKLRAKHSDSGARMIHGTGRWIHADGRPGDYEVLLPTDARCNVAVLRWGALTGVGRVITQRARLRALVQAAERVQASRRSRAAVSKTSGNKSRAADTDVPVIASVVVEPFICTCALVDQRPWRQHCERPRRC